MTKIMKLIEWHRDLMNDMADRFNLSAYQIVWIAFGKGMVFGYLIGEFL